MYFKSFILIFNINFKNKEKVKTYNTNTTTTTTTSTSTTTSTTTKKHNKDSKYIYFTTFVVTKLWGERVFLNKMTYQYSNIVSELN